MKEKDMKTLEEIQAEQKLGTVYATEDFIEEVKKGKFIVYFGEGYFHDGEKETTVNIWDCGGRFEFEFSKQYPYVCWYNKKEWFKKHGWEIN